MKDYARWISDITDNRAKELANRRKQFVAALATAIFVSHVEPAGKTEALCHQVLQWGKPLYTHRSDLNANLLSMGAVPLDAVSNL